MDRGFRIKVAGKAKTPASAFDTQALGVTIPPFIIHLRAISHVIWSPRKSTQANTF